MKLIELVVTPDGQSRVETKGFSGAECQEASRFLEAALGTRHSERLTAEYHQAAGTRQTETRQEG